MRYLYQISFTETVGKTLIHSMIELHAEDAIEAGKLAKEFLEVDLARNFRIWQILEISREEEDHSETSEAEA